MTRAVRHGHHYSHIGHMRIGCESFDSVQHPALFVRLRAVATAEGASLPGVGAGLRLGQRPRSDPFARGQLRNIAPLLFLAAGRVDVIVHSETCAATLKAMEGSTRASSSITMA